MKFNIGDICIWTQSSGAQFIVEITNKSKGNPDIEVATSYDTWYRVRYFPEINKFPWIESVPEPRLRKASIEELLSL